AVELDAGDVQVATLRYADGEKNRVEAERPELRDAEFRREGRVDLEPDAERQDLVDLGADQRARQPVFGNAEADHPARLVPGFEHGDLVAEEREIVRG